MNQLTINLEALSLLVAGFMLFVTARRKGKNRTLQITAWFFVAGGFFRLGMYMSNLFSVLPDWSLLTLVFSNACLYFGIAVYISMQFDFLRGRRAAKVSLLIGIFLATLLTFYHFYGLALNFNLANPWVGNQFLVMVLALGVGFIFMVGLFFSFLLQAKKQKISLLSNSTVNFGLGLMLVSWILQKVVVVGAGSLVGLALTSMPFISIVIIGVALFLQTSSSMAPGIVYNSYTKKPVPLAIVRVFRASDQKLLESRVTDESGRYGMLVGPGSYTIEAVAANLQFPTNLAVGYRGEIVARPKPSVLGFDIFLDPTG